LKRLTLLALSLSVMTTGCATKLLGVKAAGSASQAIQGAAEKAPLNWKPGDPTPAGYTDGVTVRVQLPQELLRKVQLLPYNPSQVLLYVRDPDLTDNPATGNALEDAVTDAFNTANNAMYVAPIDPVSGKAEFRLPPMPGSGATLPSQSPTGTAGSANAYRFEVRVYDSFANGIITADDFYGHKTPATAAPLNSLSNSAIIASGEVLATVLPGLPIVVKVPYVFEHASGNIDSKNFTQVTKSEKLNPTLDSATASDKVYRVRMTAFNPANMDATNASASIFVGDNAADTGPLALNFANTAGLNQTVVGTGANRTALIDDLVSDLSGIAAFANNYYVRRSTDNASLEIKAKTNATNLNAVLTNKSIILGNQVSISNGVNPFGGVKSSVDFDLAGTIDVGELVQYSFTDVGANGVPGGGDDTVYAQVITTTGNTLASLATQIVSSINTAFGATWDASVIGAGTSIRITADAVGAARTLAVNPTVARTASTLSAPLGAATAENLGSNGINNPTAPTPYKRSLVVGAGGAVAGDKVIVTFGPVTAGGSNLTQQLLFSSTRTQAQAAQDIIDDFNNNAALATHRAHFTVAAGAAAGEVQYTARYIPTAYTVSSTDVPNPNPLPTVSAANAVATSGQSNNGGTAANGTIDIDRLTAGDAWDAADKVSLIINGPGFPANHTVESAAITTATAAGAASAVRTALNGDATFTGQFNAVADPAPGSILTLVATASVSSQTYTFDVRRSFRAASFAGITATQTATTASVSGGTGGAGMSHRLRVRIKFPSGTTFDNGNLPTLTATDGNQNVGPLGSVLGSIVNASDGGAPVNGTTLSTALDSRTRVFDINADSGVSGPWNFSLFLKGTTLGVGNTEFTFFDADTAGGDGSSAVTAQ
jgi:hypothetical protein